MKKTKTVSKANPQPFTEQSREQKSTIACVLLSMSRMSTLNFEYEQCEYNIKISMTAYMYQKL